ncbi:MAG: carboxylating nicotinate-nucleotide diphosphorylase [Candidatus Bathyarchaeota archaeon]
MPQKVLEDKLRRFLVEDLGQGDITTVLIVPEDSRAEAEMITKENGVIAGMEEARIMVEGLELEIDVKVSDGENIDAKSVLARISGNTRTILSVERTLLNLVSRMSGIATMTRQLTEKLRKAGYETKIASTRKVAPGLLYFDKKAVMIGGGDTHRLHLDDMILIKDNHIAVAGSVKEAIERVKEKVSFSKKIEVEVTSVEKALTAAKAGADIIMLDNFTPQQIEDAVRSLKNEQKYEQVLIEVSGGITPTNILRCASKGIDIISLGRLTKSPEALDLSLEVTRIQ